MTTTTMITRRCECGTTFETDDWSNQELCPACEAAHAAKLQEAYRLTKAKEDAEAIRTSCDAIVAAIHQQTPTRILATDHGDPRWNRELWEAVERWQPSVEAPWLGLVGEPGTCKTRALFAKLRQLAQARIEKAGVTAGRMHSPTWAVVSGYAFKQHVMDQFSGVMLEGAWNAKPVAASDLAKDALRRFQTADILLFDEIGEKIKPSPAVMEALFALIDYRHSRNLVTLWSCNSRPESFCASWPTEFAGPIAGRIVEASTIIQA
jgi:hypothetical protein